MPKLKFVIKALGPILFAIGLLCAHASAQALHPAESEAPKPNPVSNQQEKPATTFDDEPAPEEEPAAAPETESMEKEPEPEDNAEVESEAQPEPEEKTKTTLHHSAMVRTPVYVTVWHTRSERTTVTTGGETAITWTSCPTCGKRHSSSFQTQVLDHYETLLCPQCGKAHEKDYDEEVG